MTTNIDLIKMAKTLNIANFRGVFMKDELKNMTPNENECAIVNCERSDQKGSHWTSYVKYGKQKYFFCSFGSPIVSEIKEYLGSPILCSNFQIQSFDSSECGELCILFLYLMSSGLNYEDIIISMLPN